MYAPLTAQRSHGARASPQRGKRMAVGASEGARSHVAIHVAVFKCFCCSRPPTASPTSQPTRAPSCPEAPRHAPRRSRYLQRTELQRERAHTARPSHTKHRANSHVQKVSKRGGVPHTQPLVTSTVHAVVTFDTGHILMPMSQVRCTQPRLGGAVGRAWSATRVRAKPTYVTLERPSVDFLKLRERRRAEWHVGHGRRHGNCGPACRHDRR